MSSFKYSDENIDENELMIALPAIMIGVSVLSLPSKIAKVTLFSDGWISILLGGILFVFFTVLAVKLASLFPEKSFYSYTSILVTKPVAIVLTFLNICVGIMISSITIRSLAYISQQYLFEQTPMEILALCFLLVVIYAVSGSRAGIFRLNVLFMPIILVSVFFVVILNIKQFELENFLPLFKSKPKNYLQGIIKTYDVFVGFGIVLFYVSLIHKPRNLIKKVVIGVSIPIVFYIAIFLVSIAVFGNAVTGNLSYPTIELAKRIDIPGGIFERIEALFFTIWIMAIFNTVAIALDVALLLIMSVFKKMNKRILAFFLSPIIYYISMLPQQVDQVSTLVNITSQLTVYFTCSFIIVLLLAAKIRGVTNSEKN